MENETLKRELIESCAPEYKIYAENLQEENKKMAERLSKMVGLVENSDSYTSKEKSFSEEQLVDLEHRKNQVEAKLQEAEYELELEQ
jgi:hypothetical protein